jgi:hypothetical protein
LSEQTGAPLKVEAQWAEPVSLTFHTVLSKPYAEPFMGASYQVSVNFAKQFQRRRLFLEINRSEIYFSCGGHV